LEIPDEAVGKLGKCPGCGLIVQINKDVKISKNCPLENDSLHSLNNEKKKLESIKGGSAISPEGALV
jgi:transcription initiation factor IIE alpha subunit